MKLSIGIVGLPNVGKSTLFKILTNQEVNIANYPFATIDPNVGVVLVPDDRLRKLAEIGRSKKIIPAVVEFYDIAGLVKGASKGEGLGNQFLSHIREVNAIVQVVRCFKEDDIVHIEKNVDPIRDLEIIQTELALKDLETVEKRFRKAEADARTGKKEFIEICGILNEVKTELEKGIPLFASQKYPDILKGVGILRELNLLTAKSQLFLLNGSEEDVDESLKLKIGEWGGNFLIANLTTCDVVNITTLIREAHRILNLISFFTTGEDETRAWTIVKGTKAREAAGAIHSDFENKFIRAEVIFWEKLLEAGSWNEAKQRGWLRLEGKDYVVKDGDVMVIRHG